MVEKCDGIVGWGQGMCFVVTNWTVYVVGHLLGFRDCAMVLDCAGVPTGCSVLENARALGTVWVRVTCPLEDY